MYRQVVLRGCAVDPAPESEMRGVLAVQLAKNHELAVDAADRVRDEFLEDVGQVASLPQSVFIGAVVGFGSEEIDSAPGGGDHDRAEVARGLCDRAEPLGCYC